MHGAYPYQRSELRRRLLVAGAATSVLPALARAQAGGKPVRIIVGFPAGGATDVIARMIADKLRGSLAPAVLVENRAGASGRLAAEFVKQSDPDGTTLLFTPDFLMTVYPHSFRKLSYDPLRDFVPVATASGSMLTLAAGPGLPASITTVAGYLDWCRANPKQATYATTSAGATPHFVGVMLARATGVDLTAVHYKGGAQSLQDLMGGQIPVSVNPVSEAIPQIRAGKVRALAVTGRERTRFLPDVPTFVEQGYQGIVTESWLGFLAAAKTPPDVVARVNNAINRALETPEVQAGLEKFAVSPRALTPAAFADVIRNELAHWGPIVKASGFAAED